MLQRVRRFVQRQIRILRGRRVYVASGVLAVGVQIASSQALSISGSQDDLAVRPSFESVCKAQIQDPAHAALQMVCQNDLVVRAESSTAQTIVIGFVGGFADPDDEKHPEVLFADYLRERYGSKVHVEVFSNHDGKGALRYAMALLDANHDGFLSGNEKTSARIIIYGHSWGASETTAFARELQHYSIPVLLTIQLDIVSKWRQHPSRIPSNVESAVNFFQSEGLLQGRSRIVASDVTRTEIIGNFRSTYIDRPVNCDNYPWLARTFNKPHHEIENDPDVWDQIASLVDMKVSRARGASKLSTGRLMTNAQCESGVENSSWCDSR
jgi:hypothetical protein